MAQKTWNVTTGGNWSTAGLWTPNGAATSADDATITGPTGSTYQVVNGPGNSASLTLLGNTTLNGAFVTGALAVGTAAGQGALSLASGTTLTASTATLLYGPLTATGIGTKLTVSGALTLGGVRSNGSYYVNDALLVSGGAAVQAGNLTLAPAVYSYTVGVGSQSYVEGTSTVSVADSASSMEIGTLGGAAAGKITVDAGFSVAGTGSLSSTSGIVDNGVILAQGGALSLNAPVTGTGQLQIGAGATLSLSASGVSTTAVGFVGAAGTLQISSSSVYNGTFYTNVLTEAGPITGFALGDLIGIQSYGNAVDGVSYQIGVGGIGTLTVRSGTTVLGTLSLIGDYTGLSFLITPQAGSSSTYNINLQGSGGSGGTPSPGTSTPDVYTWLPTTGGDWFNVQNWKDVTTGASPASIAPGVNDLVTITGPTGSTYQVVNGPGNSASLTLLGNTTLSGTFATGALLVGTAAASGALSLASGTVLRAGSATLLYGPMAVTGSQVTISGALTLGGTRSNGSSYVNDNLVLSGSSVVQLGSLTLLPGTYAYTVPGVGLQSYVEGTSTVSLADSGSSLEIGTLGGAAAGKVTVDAGSSLVGNGSVGGYSGIVDNGTILAQGGTLSLNSAVTGSGQLQIGAGATLSVSTSGISTAAVNFAGTAGTLQVSASSVYNGTFYTNALTETGTITGFTTGDVIGVYSYSNAVTAVSYQAGTGGIGTLTVKSGAIILGSLALSGDYSALTFLVTPQANSTTAYNIILQPSTPGGTLSSGTTSRDTYSWLPTTGGNWSDATKWSDVSTSANPAAVAPGVNDAVTITGPTGNTYQVVNGPGNSASLTAVGNTTLNGAFATGALAVGTAASAGALSLAAGATLTASSATLLYGPLTITGPGTRLTVAGALNLGGARSNGSIYANDVLTVNGGAAVQVGSVSMQPGIYAYMVAGGGSQSYVEGTSTVSVADSSSSLEVGALGGAAAGKLTVDAGSGIAGNGTVNGNSGIVDNGTIMAQLGTLTLGAAVTGSGQLQIAAGATLALSASGVSTTPVSFVGAAGTLQVNVTNLYNPGTYAYTNALTEAGTITGFTFGDIINVSSYSNPVTTLTYQPGPGTLTVKSGKTVLGSLTLAGDYTGTTFLVTPQANSSTAYNITLQQGGPGNIAPVKANNDLNGDGKSDVVLQNSSGATVVYTMNGGLITAGTSIGVFGPGTQVVGTGDFNGDGTSDTLIEGPGGSLTLFLVSNTAYTAGYSLGSYGSAWNVAGTGDFNGDGKSDILLQNVNGSVVGFTMNGGSVTAGTSYGNFGTSKVVGIGDFNGDGTSDMLIQGTDGTLTEFAVKNNGFTAGYTIGTFAGFKVAGVGDYNGDGKSDILLQSTVDNSAVIFTMNGGTVTAGTSLGTLGNTKVVASGDYNGDGTSDIVTQASNGALTLFTVVNDAVTAGFTLGNPGLSWHLIDPTLPGALPAISQAAPPPGFITTSSVAPDATLPTADDALAAAAQSGAAPPDPATPMAATVTPGPATPQSAGVIPSDPAAAMPAFTTDPASVIRAA